MRATAAVELAVSAFIGMGDVSQLRPYFPIATAIGKHGGYRLGHGNDPSTRSARPPAHSRPSAHRERDRDVRLRRRRCRVGRVRARQPADGAGPSGAPARGGRPRPPVVDPRPRCLSRPVRHGRRLVERDRAPEPAGWTPGAGHPRADARRVVVGQRAGVRARTPVRLRRAGPTLGATGWEYENVLPYFERADGLVGRPTGVDTGLSVVALPEPHPITNDFVAAALSPPGSGANDDVSWSSTAWAGCEPPCVRGGAGARPTPICGRRSAGRTSRCRRRRMRRACSSTAGVPSASSTCTRVRSPLPMPAR